MQQPLAGDAARNAGVAAGAPPSGTLAASGCAAVVGGVVRLPAALRVRAVVPNTVAWRPQAACNMHVRVPASVCAPLRAVRPRARASARHTRVSPKILSVLPAGSRHGVCAPGLPPISCSLSLSLSLSLLRVLPATCLSRGHLGGGPTGEQTSVRPSAQPR